MQVSIEASALWMYLEGLDAMSHFWSRGHSQGVRGLSSAHMLCRACCLFWALNETKGLMEMALGLSAMTST